MTTTLLWLALTGVPDIPPGPTAWTLRPMVERVADIYLIPRHIAVRQAFAESGWRPSVVNSHRTIGGRIVMSRGLFQINRYHEAELVWRSGLHHFDWRDPVQSAIVGMSYLSRLKAKYGDWRRALAAYNWGPGNVDKTYWKARAIEQEREALGSAPEYVPPSQWWPRETVEYVRRILR